ncbi:NB-ARC domains-containing protein, partial [Tanacetum coccineum]
DDSDDDGNNDASGDERTESDEDENPNLNQNDDDKEEEYEDEYVRTPANYESNDDENENVDEEEYDRIDEELYKDVNVELKDVVHGEEGKGDAEMTNAGHDDVTQETTYDQVEDDAHVTLIDAHVTQKTEVPLQSSFVSSDFATQFLNFDNIPPTDNEIISMMNVNVRHEEPKFKKEAQAKKKRYIDLIEKSVKDIINNEVKTQLPQILPKAVSDFATPAVASLTEFESKKILIDKMEKSQSNLTADEHKELYKALVNSYNVDKDLFLSKGSKSKESKSTSSSKGTTRSQPKSFGKSAQAEEPIHTVDDTEVQQNQGQDMVGGRPSTMSRKLPEEAQYNQARDIQILKTESLKISSVSEGTKVIKQRMACKPILLVLDEVNDLEQIEALAGSPDWFSPGSLIIFTGKDKQLLRSHNVEIYEMEILDDCKALELFSLNAFGKRHPTQDFEELAFRIVKYLQGHPLALKVIGRSLYGKSIHVWESELDRLQTNPNPDIQQKLRPSFDGLASDQKRMFLDIACAFIGENKDFAASVLDSHNCSANAIIEVLVDKSLITVCATNMSLQMHELIQSMAREIVREKFDMPGNRSRLWISLEFHDSLSENKVTEEVEVLVVLLKNGQKITVDGKAFTRMKNLRILKICSPIVEGLWQPFAVNCSGSLDFLSDELRLFYWHGFPFKYLPSDFYPQNIVAIDLSYSQIKHIWKTPKCFKRLKVMNLSNCCNLTTTPDFSEITNLEELSLEGCVNLVSVHPSIGMLKRLVVLNLRDCKQLQNFPSRVEMDALQVLNLTGCLKVDQLPEALGRITSLMELHADRTAITEVPSFVSSLINLESLSFGGQGRIQPRWWTSITAPFGLLIQVPESIGGLSCLKKLNLEGNNILEVPESIGFLSCLKYLYLGGNNFTTLPGSLSQLSSLEWLDVDGCKKLEVLAELPPSLREINASDCTSLREVMGSSKDQFKSRFNNFGNCPKLFKNDTIDIEGYIISWE